MRVTDNSRNMLVLRELSSLASRQLQATEQASSGLRVNRPGDDPTAAAELVRLHSATARNATFRANVAGVRGDAETAEGALAQASDLLDSARQLAMQAANGTLTADQRTTLAGQVSGIFDQLRAVANTKGSKGYLFAGSKTDQEPFDSTGAFVGHDAAQPVEVGPNLSIDTAVSGAQAFTTAGGRDVFADLKALEQALTSNDQAGVSAAVDAVTASHDQVVQARSRSGLLLARLDVADSALDQSDAALAERTQAAGDADPYQTISNLNNVQSAIEQALAVARKTLDPSRF